MVDIRISYICSKCGKRISIPATRRGNQFSKAIPKYGYKTQYRRRVCKKHL